MFVVVLILLLSFVGFMASVFLLGFRLGGEHWRSELLRVRATAAEAQRRLHELTREAFVAMAEEAQRLRRPEP